jgi:hypothetical protein
MITPEVLKQLQENFDTLCAKQDPNKTVETMTAFTNMQIAGELRQINKMLLSVVKMMTVMLQPKTNMANTGRVSEPGHAGQSAATSQGPPIKLQVSQQPKQPDKKSVTA